MSECFVDIEDYCDGFSIVITQNGEEQRFSFDQEDDKTGLVDVFAALGFEVNYHESY